LDAFLVLSQSCVVTKTSVVGVFDLDNCTYNRRAAAFVNSVNPNSADDKLPLSFVITANNTILSGLSTRNIMKRFQSNATKYLHR
jgi:hypothetical protein